jgi:flagellar hook-associated protein 3 FlgL
MSRIATFAAQQVTLQNNLSSQSRIQEGRIALSSGKQAETHDGIASDVRRLQSLSTRFQANEAFTNNIQRTELRLQEQENVVSNLQEIATSFRTTLVGAANGSNFESAQIENIASRLRDQVVSLLNTELEGRHLFSGSATDTPPIDPAQIASATPADYFQGNNQELSVRVDRGVEVQFGVTADPAAQTGFDDLIQSLNLIAENNPVSEANVQTALGLVTDAVPQIADTQADIGSTLDVIQRTRERLLDSNVEVGGAISNIEDVDITQVMTRLSLEQTALDTSFAVTSRLSQTSLLNFLR